MRVAPRLGKNKLVPCKRETAAAYLIDGSILVQRDRNTLCSILNVSEGYHARVNRCLVLLGCSTGLRFEEKCPRYLPAIRSDIATLTLETVCGFNEVTAVPGASSRVLALFVLYHPRQTSLQSLRTRRKEVPPICTFGRSHRRLVAY